MHIGSARPRQSSESAMLPCSTISGSCLRLPTQRGWCRSETSALRRSFRAWSSSRAVEPILRICDGDAAAVDMTADLALAAMIVALASDIDCETSINARASHRDSTMGHVVPWVPRP